MKKYVALFVFIIAVIITIASCSEVGSTEIYVRSNSTTSTSTEAPKPDFEKSLNSCTKNSVLDLDDFCEEMFGGTICEHVNYDEVVFYHVPDKGEAGVMIICDKDRNYKSVYAVGENDDKPIGFVLEITDKEKFYNVRANGLKIAKVPESALRFLAGAAEMIKEDIPLKEAE